MIGELEERAPTLAGPYGHFAEDGREYHVTEPRTPRPWINLIATPRIGLAVSQTGSGFSWIDNAQLAALTRWQQELAEDRSGRFLYLCDRSHETLRSLAPAPCWPAYEHFVCRHGLGYTTFETELDGLAASWTLFCDPQETIEHWRVSLVNRSERPRSLELCAFVEWCMGVSPAPRREFGKLFLETDFEPQHRAILAGNHMWDVASPRWGHWNTPFPYWSAFAALQPLDGAQGDKAAFLGRYGEWRSPAALSTRVWRPLVGRHHDPIAALRSPVELGAGERRELGWVLATGATRDEALALVAAASLAGADRALAAVVAGWRERLAAHRIATPEPTLDLLANDWLRYQAIAARLWGRCGYYQQSGAFGFRDQLQDSQVWLTIDPPRCREQIALHAAHQFVDGSVYHWWHPLSEQGHVTRMTDDLLWLAFVAASYLKETGDFSLLDDPAPFLDDPTPAPLVEHVTRAFARAFARTSARGLPLIGAGDWNDGLSAVGLEGRGESIWLGHFLALLLAEWSEVHRRRGEATRATELLARRRALVEAINQHGWDGAWYRRACRDDGEWIGSVGNRVGRIYLNAQTWALLADVAPPERAAACLAAVREHLLSEAGALLLAPAYDAPVPEIGYITRYGPGLRENGGVYTHAATWAIAAAAKAKDAELVDRLLRAINPALKDPESYWAEPYVLPGNVDGPASPLQGRAGWTWYTGAAAWLPRIVSQWVLGVRPDWEGLRFDPCLPPGWCGAHMTRRYRGARLEIEIERRGAPGRVEVTVDGEALGLPLLRRVEAGATHQVRVVCG